MRPDGRLPTRRVDSYHRRHTARRINAAWPRSKGVAAVRFDLKRRAKPGTYLATETETNERKSETN